LCICRIRSRICGRHQRSEWGHYHPTSVKTCSNDERKQYDSKEHRNDNPHNGDIPSMSIFANIELTTDPIVGRIICIDDLDPVVISRKHIGVDIPFILAIIINIHIHGSKGLRILTYKHVNHVPALNLILIPEKRTIISLST